MKKLLNSRQLSMVLFICVVSLKFLVFPALTTKYAGRDAYISIFFYLIIEFAIVLFVLLFMKGYPNLTFKDAITKSIGEVFAKIVYFILFLYFLFKTLFLIKETHNYFLEVIFDELPWFYFTMPLTAFLCFVMSKSMMSMARTIEILFWFIIISIGLTSIAPAYRIDMLNIFPVLEHGVWPVVNGMFYSTFSFGDFLVLMMLMGRVKFEKDTIKKVLWFGVFCIIFVTTFYIIFIAIFDNSGVNHILALSDISVRSSYPYTQEKLDWLAILIWTITLLYQIGVYAIITKNCLVEVIPFKKKSIPIAIIAGLLFILSFVLYLNLELMIKIVSSVPFLIAILSIHVAIPILLLICFLILNGKSDSKRKSNKSNNYLKSTSTTRKGNVGGKAI